MQHPEAIQNQSVDTPVNRWLTKSVSNFDPRQSSETIALSGWCLVCQRVEPVTAGRSRRDMCRSDLLAPIRVSEIMSMA